MPIADKKKAATVIGLLNKKVIEPLVQANEVAGKLRQAIIDNGLTAQFTAGELTALQGFVTDLAALAGSSVVAAIQARVSPTHKCRALIIEGVNDGS